jgi:hypothetical protein
LVTNNQPDTPLLFNYQTPDSVITHEGDLEQPVRVKKQIVVHCRTVEKDFFRKNKIESFNPGFCVILFMDKIQKKGYREGRQQIQPINPVVIYKKQREGARKFIGQF